MHSKFYSETLKGKHQLGYIGIEGTITSNTDLKDIGCCGRSRDSSVGIATGYGLDCRVSIPGRGKIFVFSTASRQALGSIQPPIQ
jgi:hypothetical protein